MLTRRIAQISENHSDVNKFKKMIKDKFLSSLIKDPFKLNPRILFKKLSNKSRKANNYGSVIIHVSIFHINHIINIT